jgi:hypothetical protein
MTLTNQDWGERFVRLTLAIDEHLPGYIDSYFGPAAWQAESKLTGKLPLPDLTEQVNQFASDVSQADDLPAQRRDYLARHATAMQMTLRLLAGEQVSLADEVQALYDVQPQWTDESIFEQSLQELDDILPGNGSLQERLNSWKKSFEVSVEKIRDLLPRITDKLREPTRKKFDLPDDESFVVEFVSNQPWGAYNWYLGNSRSRIDINTDLPLLISRIPALMAHEGYPGHHTDLSIKEKKLVQGLNYSEFTVNLLNAPSAVMAEGIATSALETILTDEELEAWFREEILPAAGMSHLDSKSILAFNHANRKTDALSGNAAFMLHDQHKSEEEIIQYIQKHRLSTEKEARQTIKFISNPLYRSYIFTYYVGHELLEELFQHGNRDAYFKRLLEEPVTPSLVRQWIDRDMSFSQRDTAFGTV